MMARRSEGRRMARWWAAARGLQTLEWVALGLVVLALLGAVVVALNSAAGRQAAESVSRAVQRSFECLTNPSACPAGGAAGGPAKPPQVSQPGAQPPRGPGGGAPVRPPQVSQPGGQQPMSGRGGPFTTPGLSQPQPGVNPFPIVGKAWEWIETFAKLKGFKGVPWLGVVITIASDLYEYGVGSRSTAHGGPGLFSAEFLAALTVDLVFSTTLSAATSAAIVALCGELIAAGGIGGVLCVGGVLALSTGFDMAFGAGAFGIRPWLIERLKNFYEWIWKSLFGRMEGVYEWTWTGFQPRPSLAGL